ncbi:hypothetical protein CK214_24320 [Mesorhizobium sp. WSM3882]|nr:hypothetical protein CK214_24320 [Mesorhizobium sp. WSM3882]
MIENARKDVLSSPAFRSCFGVMSGLASSMCGCMRASATLLAVPVFIGSRQRTRKYASTLRLA